MRLRPRNRFEWKIGATIKPSFAIRPRNSEHRPEAAFGAPNIWTRAFSRLCLRTSGNNTGQYIY